jgi:hypothetical protein
MFDRIRRKLAIRGYAVRLPALLRHDYGRASTGAPYTAAQVQRTIERYGLSRTYLPYAVAMFADKNGFAAYQVQFEVQFGGDEKYVEVLAQIASAVGHSGSNMNFAGHEGFGTGGADHFGGGHDSGGGHGSGDAVH